MTFPTLISVYDNSPDEIIQVDDTRVAYEHDEICLGYRQHLTLRIHNKLYQSQIKHHIHNNK